MDEPKYVLVIEDDPEDLCALINAIAVRGLGGVIAVVATRVTEAANFTLKRLKESGIIPVAAIVDGRYRKSRFSFEEGENGPSLSTLGDWGGWSGHPIIAASRSAALNIAMMKQGATHRIGENCPDDASDLRKMEAADILFRLPCLQD